MENNETPTNTEQILKALKDIDEKVSKVTTLLVGSITEDKPGLLERVRKLEEWVSNEKKFLYAISIVIIIDVAMKVWNLIETH